MEGTDFAARLEYLLETRGVSRKWLALKANISLMYIGQLLSGTSKKPSLEVATAIAKAFEVPLEWLAGGESMEVDPPDLTPDEQELLALYRELHPDARRMFLEVTRSQVRFANRLSRSRPPTPNSEPSTDKT